MMGKLDLNRRAFLAGLLASSASPALAFAPDRSPRPGHRTTKAVLAGIGTPEALIERADLGGTVAFAVADADSGEILESHNVNVMLPPASTTKAITTLYALDTLGADHRFRTEISVTGPLVNGRLEGDLYLVGGGDPTLDTDALATLASRLKEAGLREISGRAYVFAALLPYQRGIDPDQPDHLGYNPSLSGLNLNYNRVFFEWTRQGSEYLTTMDARAAKHRPRVSMARMEVVDRKAPVFTYQSTMAGDRWTVAKRALGKKGGRWLPVRRPDLYAGEVFRTMAGAYGIQLPEFQPISRLPEGRVLAHWDSEELAPILKAMMKYSNNLIAELTGLGASKARGKSPKRLAASGAHMSDWAFGRGMERSLFVDHSGLGDQSRVSAGEMLHMVLQTGWDSPLRSLMKEVPLYDKDGKPLKQNEIKIWAKTGTLNFVSALTGYVETAGGRRLAFSFLSADIDRREALSRAERERPKGARSWNRRSKHLQQQLVERWSAAFGA